jgi:hypothetical protein
VTAEGDREAEILALLLAGDPAGGLVERVCELGADLLGVSGAGLCIVLGSQQQMFVHGTDSVAEELEDLQAVFGQGPCIEAVRAGAPVVVPELANFRSTSWDRYAERALALGVRAVFTFPLQVDDRQLGALDLYRITPGPLDPAQSGDAALLTSILTRTLIAQRDQIDLDSSVNALSVMTAALREPTNGAPPRLADLGLTVAHATPVAQPEGPTEPTASSSAFDPGRDGT